MGKGSDKLYITHSEWSSSDAFGPTAGANVRKPANKGAQHASFKRLPFNFCALSLQPFSHPVCTTDGAAIFDLTHILPWIKEHGTNPVNGEQLATKNLIQLHFATNEAGEYVDPVTYKVFTDNTHLVAIKTTGNVFAWETVERLNIKAKNWHDLVSEQEFKRSDVITLQDPQNVASRDLSAFKYLQDGVSTLTPEQEAERAAGVNVQTLGSAAKILKAKDAVAKRRAERELHPSARSSSSAQALNSAPHRSFAQDPAKSRTTQPVPYNAARHTNGLAAASFTSTGLTPSTSNAPALLSAEDYMLHPRRVLIKGYVRLHTTQGELHLELDPEYAPKAVWNFIRLAQRGYYEGVAFHRNIRSFMLQGGDPTGTGRGGESCWAPEKKTFADEFEGPGGKMESRGVLAMANKGKDTNTSQFFILYRGAKHLERKHTVFGRVVPGEEGEAALRKLEEMEVDGNSRPLAECRVLHAVVYVDPFEEFARLRGEGEREEAKKEAARQAGGEEEEGERTTWTGKRIRADGKVKANAEGEDAVGKYLRQAAQGDEDDGEAVEEWETAEPAKKRTKGEGGGFGNFDAW